MVSSRVAELYNEYVVKRSREVDSSARRNLSSSEKKELENLEANWQSAGVAQSIQVQKQLEQGEIGVETIDISKQSPKEAGFYVDGGQREESLMGVGRGEGRINEFKQERSRANDILGITSVSPFEKAMGYKFYSTKEEIIKVPLVSTSKGIEPSYIPDEIFIEEEKPQELSISEYEPFTFEEQKESRRLRFTEQEGFFDMVGGAYQKSAIPKIASDAKSFFGFGGYADYKQEAFSLAPISYDYPTRQTISFAQKPDIDLSEQALVYRQEIRQEIPEQIRIEQEILGKKEEILGDISKGGITQFEADWGNKQLKAFADLKWKGYQEGYKERTKQREEFAFQLKRPTEFKLSKFIKSKTPEFFDFKPYKFEKGVFEKLDFGGEFGGTLAGFGAVAGTGGISFTKGAYEGLREKPFKTITTGAIVAGVTFATSGLGTAGALGTYGVTAIKIAKPLQIALGTGYGASVVGRVGTLNGYERFEKAGEITSTELLPMFAGYKVGSYFGTRTGLYVERSRVLRGESQLLPKGFEFDKTELAKIQKEFNIAKSLRSVQPEVKELSFAGMERLTPKQQGIIKSFLLERKGKIVVGGTAGTRGQLLIKEQRLPKDIDVFVRGFRQEATASKYLSELGKQLNLKVKGGAIRGLGGEKLIEFKPFGQYLKPNIEQVFPVYRTYRAGITTSPEGFKVLRLSSQGMQKVLGYARYGQPRTKDIIAYFTQIKPSLQIAKQEQVLTSPTLTDFKISQAPQTFSFGTGISAEIGGVSLNNIEKLYPKYSEISYPSYPTYKSLLKTGYPSYPKTIKSPTYFKTPKTKTTPYKPFKDIDKGYYPRITDYSPYKPTKPSKQPPSKYKPFEFELIPPTFITPPMQTKKKKSFFFGDMSLGMSKKDRLLPKRIFQRTPSYKAVYGGEFGFKTPKVSESIEKTGIVERAYKTPKIIKPLGPFKL